MKPGEEENDKMSPASVSIYLCHLSLCTSNTGEMQSNLGYKVTKHGLEFFF